jgi:EAL domain-containing protein (putative c-di-GMP-specific phosphodiesterase class I)
MAVSQFTDSLPAFVLEALETNHLAPERLVLEVTESEIAEPAVSRQAGRLRRGGVRIALDDFGSGYSSLAQLATLPVDILKIDRGFILSLDGDSGRQVLDTVVALARSLDLESVAEGIETQVQARAVESAGIDLVQGFLFSRPLEPGDLVAQLAELPASSIADRPGGP